ncbi:hypothetical protein C2845_PM15G14010 [Panicum miliaceum]|uniref:Uncharacterized protein n=1 Tax=Panicum miliaceum TaxID=4540 RepID=A0A3L6Q5V6_PANMI|nr:hypothetical protein C2845_PM15G14010 [Panicum miliaceum]
MYYPTGNSRYIAAAAAAPGLAEHARAFDDILDLSVFSWDNKLPGAGLLLSRLRMFLNPGYPYEGSLAGYHKTSGLDIFFKSKTRLYIESDKQDLTGVTSLHESNREEKTDT